MSDNNVPADVCDVQELNPYLDIPTEAWTDMFKLLPRRILVLQIQPVNSCFKAICDKNVKSVHVIENAQKFIWKLADGGYPKEIKHLEDLAGHKCELASQFRIAKFRFSRDYLEDIDKAILVMSHCMDLFRGVQMLLKNDLECLAKLEGVKPTNIKLVDSDCTEELEKSLRHPTVLSCRRLEIGDCSRTMALFKWLHHKPIRTDQENNSSKNCAADEPKPRCLTLSNNVFELQAIEWLLEWAINHFQLSRMPLQRRHFLFSFNYPEQSDQAIFARIVKARDQDTFGHIENTATGEVLLLERVGENGLASRSYRLLRCMASQVANGTEEFYAKMFKTNG